MHSACHLTVLKLFLIIGNFEFTFEINCIIFCHVFRIISFSCRHNNFRTPVVLNVPTVLEIILTLLYSDIACQMIQLIIKCPTFFKFYGIFEPYLKKILNLYCSRLNEISKIRNFGPNFEIMWYFYCHHFIHCSCCFYDFCWFFCIVVITVHSYVAIAVDVPNAVDFAISVSVSLSVDFSISVAIDVSVYVAVCYCCCRNSLVNILSTVIAANIVASVSGTTAHVNRYVVILIYIIIGVGVGVDGGYYIWLTMLVLPWLINFALTSFTDSLKVRHGKNEKITTQWKGCPL